MELSMPVVWSDRCLLHEPVAEIWVGVPTPAAVPYVFAHRGLGARRTPSAVWARPGWFAYDSLPTDPALELAGSGTGHGAACILAG